jgi:hypothetical protein
MVRSSYRLRFPGRCVNADPAADLAAFDERGLRSTLLAARAAFALVTSRFRRAIWFSPPNEFLDFLLM